jgi:hypothetical protein
MKKRDLFGLKVPNEQCPGEHLMLALLAESPHGKMWGVCVCVLAYLSV